MDAVAGTALLAAVVASLLLGWIIAIGYALPLLAAFVAAVVASFAVARRGVMIGVLVLAAANGIPGVNMSTPITRGFSGQDAASIFLIVAAFGWMLFDSSPASSDRLVRIFTRAALALFAWWLFTVIRTVVGDGEPFFKAVGVGRDFLYFSLLLMILPRVRLGSRDLRWLVWILGVGVAAYAVGQIATVFGLASPTWLVHTSVVRTVGGGLERVWADMTDLVVAALAVSIGAVFLAHRRNVRLAGSLLGALLVVSVIAQQGRARWLGLVAGILLVYVWTSGARRGGLVALARRRLRLVVGTAIAAIGAILVVSPSVLTNSPFTQRAISLVADLEGSSSASTQFTHNTVSVRKQILDQMFPLLGGKWAVGLGFISPHFHYFPNLPSGSIRNPDVGLFNGVMTMGVIGTVLIFIPLLFVLPRCIRRLSEHDEFAWFWFGGAIWLVSALVTSITLVTLFSTAGLVFSAVFLSVLAQTLHGAETAPQRLETPSEGRVPPVMRRRRREDAAVPG